MTGDNTACNNYSPCNGGTIDQIAFGSFSVWAAIRLVYHIMR